MFLFALTNFPLPNITDSIKGKPKKSRNSKYLIKIRKRGSRDAICGRQSLQTDIRYHPTPSGASCTNRFCDEECTVSCRFLQVSIKMRCTKLYHCRGNLKKARRCGEIWWQENASWFVCHVVNEHVVYLSYTIKDCLCTCVILVP